jgi:hypothetical protein
MAHTMKLQSITLLPPERVPYARGRAFLSHTWHVLEIFTSHLRDQHGYTLDGSRDVYIGVGGEQGDNAKYRRSPSQNETWYHFTGEFDIGKYFAGSYQDRLRMTVDALEVSLLDIAGQVGADLEPIRRAAGATRNIGVETMLPAPRVNPWHQHRPTQTTDSGRYTASLVRKVGLGIDVWGVQVRDAFGNEVLTSWIPPHKYRYISAGQQFRRARCRGDVFWLEDWKGNITYKLDVGRAARKAGATQEKGKAALQGTTKKPQRAKPRPKKGEH